MFKGKAARIRFDEEDGYYRAVVDYYSVKDRKAFRTQMHQMICSVYGTLFLQVDSNFMNKHLEGREAPWVESLIALGQENELQQEYFRFRKDKKPIFGGLIGGGQVVGYRYGAMIGSNLLSDILEHHDRIGMGLHYGVKLVAEKEESILQHFCSGQIDDLNFEGYYSIDVYDYEMVGRAVLKSSDSDELRQLAERLAQKLGAGELR